MISNQHLHTKYKNLKYCTENFRKSNVFFAVSVIFHPLAFGSWFFPAFPPPVAQKRHRRAKNLDDKLKNTTPGRSIQLSGTGKGSRPTVARD